jgi:hypothetical protein
MRALLIGATASAAALLIACHGGDSQSAAQKSAAAATDAATKAVYNDDLNAVQKHFDGELRKQVTIDQVATMSSKLKSLGAYQGLTAGPADETQRRYDFTARFAQTAVPVHVRVDPDGQLAAYRIDIPEPVSLR